MERVNKIWRHPVWKQQMEHLAEYEKNRIFCRHGMDHLMDVARIAYIENLEKNCGISKEIIYGAALLHDIGRYLQYTEGIPHEKAGEDRDPGSDCPAQRQRYRRGQPACRNTLPGR